MSLTTEIKQIIQNELPGSIIIVEDPNNDGEHFEAIVISDAFEGMPLLKQHKAIMNPLKVSQLIIVILLSHIKKISQKIKIIRILYRFINQITII